MNRKFLSIVFIFLGLVFLGVIVYFIFFHNFSAPEVIVPENKVENNTLIQKEPVVKKEETRNLAPITKPKTANLEEDLKRLAASFTERFGSFSNQAGYQNIKDLKIFMSSSMADWADRYITDEIAKNTSKTIYYGISTKAVATKMEDLDLENGTAKISVSTQRTEATGSTSNTTRFAQNIMINLVKEKGAWKVDSANWQGK